MVNDSALSCARFENEGKAGKFRISFLLHWALAGHFLEQQSASLSYCTEGHWRDLCVS